MFLQRLFAWIRTKRRGSTQSQDDLGVVISTRLKQLLPVKDPKPVDTASTQPPSKDSQNEKNRDRFGT